MLSVQLRLALKCPGCDSSVPLNGVFKNADCTRCQEVTPLTKRFRWSELLNYWNPSMNVFEATKEHRPGEGDHSAWSPLKMDSIRAWPTCPCGHVHEKSQVLAAAERGDDLTCTTCSMTLRIHPAPALLTRPFPQVRYVIGGSVPSAPSPGRVIPARQESAAINCSNCGGSLHVSGEMRTVSCQFCSTPNYLGDELWLRLHPPTRREPWWIVFDDTADTSGPTEHTLEDLLFMAASDNEMERAEAAAHPKLPVELMERMIADEEGDVRHALVQSGRLPQALLAVLFERESYSEILELAEGMTLTEPVLHALSLNTDSTAQRIAAQHPDTAEADLLLLTSNAHGRLLEALGNRALPASALHLLAKRGDRTAQRIAVRAPATAAEDLARLASSSHHEIRAALTQRPSLPDEVLKTLLADEDPEVSARMQQHPVYVRAQKEKRRRRLLIGGGVTAVLGVLGLAIGAVVALVWFLIQKGILS
ncbi:MAG: hypothetical protein P8R54_27940 [Myxococcota bacterium]|nr:hypothetical protein [Myxococcota bacterium]